MKTVSLKFSLTTLGLCVLLASCASEPKTPPEERVFAAKLPLSLQEQVPLPKSAMAYCSLEASTKKLRGEERGSFMKNCTGLNIRATPSAFLKCSKAGVRLEGKEFLDHQSDCLLKNGGERG
jgi:hypothetical protein